MRTYPLLSWISPFPLRGGFFLPVARVQAGFTLPEMLVVVAVIATLAGLAWSAYSGVQTDEQDRLGQVQLDEAAKAFRLFHQDTGYWPGDGPFALVAQGTKETLNGTGHDCDDVSSGAVLRGSLPAVNVVALSLDDQGEWFAHPANLWQMAWAPRLCANHAQARLAAWDPESGRGWRGPYLSPDKLGFVDVGNALQADGSGDPATDAAALPTRRDLYGLGAGGGELPVEDGYLDCTTPGHCAFQWRIQRSTDIGYVQADHDLAVHARPLLYFGPASGRPRLVYLGKDGVFGGLNSGDPCAPNATAVGGDDDRVACLE